MAGQSKSATLSIVIAGDPRGAQNAVRTVSNETKSLGSTVAGVGAKIGGFLAAGAVIRWGQQAVQAYRDVGGEMLKLQRLTGSTEEATSGLWVGAQQSGVSFDKLASSVGILSSKIENGTVEDLGFQVKDAAGEALGFDRVLRQIMDRFAAMENGPEKSALARQLFGRSGTDLIPLLNKGAAELDAFIAKANELGIALNAEDIKEATRNQRDFNLAMTATKFVVGKELLPALTSFAAIATDNLPAIAQAAGSVADAFNAMPEPAQRAVAVGLAFGPVVKVLGAVGAPLGGILRGLRGSGPALTNFRLGLMGVTQKGAGASNALGGLLAKARVTPGVMAGAAVGLGLFAAGFIAIYDAAGEAERQIDSLVKRAQAAGTSATEIFKQDLAESWSGSGPWDKAAGDLKSLGFTITETSAALQGGSDGWKAFTDEVNVAAVTGGMTTDEIANLNIVLLAMRHRSEGATSQQRALQAAQKALGIETEDTAGATEDYADAQGQATSQSFLDFLNKANDAISEQRDKVTGLADAQRGVRDAHLATQAAQEDLAEANAAAAGDSEEFRDALEAEVDAREALVDAQRGELDAQLALNEAREEAADNIRDMAQAAREAANDEEGAAIALERARQELARAKQDQTTTPLEMRELQLAVREAEAALAGAQADREDANQAASQAQQQGVEGNPGVIAAKEALADAADEVRAAEERVTEATRDQVRIIEDAKKRAREAARKLEDAIADEAGKWGDLAEAQGSATDGVKAHITALQGLIATLAPGSPLRVNLEATLALLQQIPTGPVPGGPDPSNPFTGWIAGFGEPAQYDVTQAPGPNGTTYPVYHPRQRGAPTIVQNIFGSSVEVQRESKRQLGKALDEAAMAVSGG